MHNKILTEICLCSYSRQRMCASKLGVEVFPVPGLASISESVTLYKWVLNDILLFLGTSFLTSASSSTQYCRHNSGLPHWDASDERLVPSRCESSLDGFMTFVYYCYLNGRGVAMSAWHCSWMVLMREACICIKYLKHIFSVKGNMQYPFRTFNELGG